MRSSQDFSDTLHRVWACGPTIAILVPEPAADAAPGNGRVRSSPGALPWRDV